MMRACFTRLWRASKGAAVVEFAFVSPLLIMFTLAVLQIGMIMQANSSIREVIGWAGREAMVSYQDKSDGVFSDATIKDMVTAKATDQAHRMKAADLTVNVATTNDGTLMVDKIKIDVSYNVDFAIPLWGAKILTLSQSRTFYAPE